LEKVYQLFPILHERKRQRAGNLSGGEQQMLAIGRALMENPHAVINTFAGNLINDEDRQHLIDFTEIESGTIPMLVNNAGIYQHAKVEDLTKEIMDKVMHINYTATVQLTQLVYEQMKKMRKGSIVNVASLSGLRGSPGNTAYVASKFALIGFTHCSALEAINHGIRVNSVCPGFVDTQMGHDVINRKATDELSSFKQNLQAVETGIPSGRITTPQEVANSIVFLLSNASSNIIGESLKISGGAVL
jgi:NAD(P)-dependent dehydrogenase (short-subunit alcohol dehydrogenase family)